MTTKTRSYVFDKDGYKYHQYSDSELKNILGIDSRPDEFQYVDVDYARRILCQFYGNADVVMEHPTMLMLYRLGIGDYDEANDKWIRVGKIQVMLSSPIKIVLEQWPEFAPRCGDLHSSWVYDKLPFTHFRRKLDGLLYTGRRMLTMGIPVENDTIFERIEDSFFQLYPITYEHSCYMHENFVIDSNPYEEVPEELDPLMPGEEGIMFKGMEGEYRVKWDTSVDVVEISKYGKLVRERTSQGKWGFYRDKKPGNESMFRDVMELHRLIGKKFLKETPMGFLYHDNGSYNIKGELYVNREKIETVVEVAKILIQTQKGVPYVYEDGFLSIPGGRLKEGESPRQAIVRELHEELPGKNVQSIFYYGSVDIQYARSMRMYNAPNSTFRIHVFVGHSLEIFDHYTRSHQQLVMEWYLSQLNVRPPAIIMDYKSVGHGRPFNLGGMLLRLTKPEKIAIFYKYFHNDMINIEFPSKYSNRTIDMQVGSKYLTLKPVGVVQSSPSLQFLPKEFFGISGVSTSVVVFKRIVHNKVIIKNFKPGQSYVIPSVDNRTLIVDEEDNVLVIRSQRIAVEEENKDVKMVQYCVLEYLPDYSVRPKVKKKENPPFVLSTKKVWQEKKPIVEDDTVT